MSDDNPLPATAPASRMALTILLVAVTAIWGWTFTVVKEAIASYGVLGFLAIRFAIASVCLGVLCGRKTTRRTLVVGGGVGLAMAAGYLLQTLGLKVTSPTNSGLITGLCVVFAPIFARVLFGSRPGWVLPFSVAASLAGMMLLTGLRPGDWTRGDLLTVGCALAFGLHVALLSRYSREHDTLVLTFAQLVAAAAVFGAGWLALEPVTWPTPAVWGSLLLTGTLASALAFYVQTKVQRHLSAGGTAVILTMEPAFAALFGYWLFGDRLGWVQWIGAALILAAMLAETISEVRTSARSGV